MLFCLIYNEYIHMRIGHISLCSKGVEGVKKERITKTQKRKSDKRKEKKKKERNKSRKIRRRKEKRHIKRENKQNNYNTTPKETKIK